MQNILETLITIFKSSHFSPNVLLFIEFSQHSLPDLQAFTTFACFAIFAA